METRTSVRLCAAALLVGSCLPVQAQQALPDRIALPGHDLVRIAEGARPAVFGERYQLGVYMPVASELRDVWSENQAKSLLVRADGPMEDRRILPGEWMHNLLPPLTESQWKALSRAVARMREGDYLRVDYLPGSGTIIRVEGQPLLGLSGHAVFLGFLRTWLGDTPVSDVLKDELVESAAEASR